MLSVYAFSLAGRICNIPPDREIPEKHELIKLVSQYWCPVWQHQAISRTMLAYHHWGHICCSMLSHEHIIVDLHQLTLDVGWGCPLHVWLAIVNVITWACCPNTHNPYEAGGMHNHISLPRYSQIYYTYNNVVQNTHSRHQKHTCVQILRGDTEQLLSYKGIS